tara:strand:- start:380 stop:880 length:501 start_codon:yes stop_codon:yes gene_type:complete
MRIILADLKNLDAIMEMYTSCVEGMLDLEIDQWDEHYPNRKIIEQDLKEACYYIGVLDNEIVAGMRLDKIQDPTYLSINWADKSNNFMVVHRLGLKTKVWNRGIGKQMMVFAEKLAKESGCSSFRLDTYSHNPKAIEFYKKLGYKQLGHIHLKPEKDIYYCFEKVF